MNIFEQQEHNKRNTLLLICAFMLLFLAIGIGFDFFILGWQNSRQDSLRQTYDPLTATYSMKVVKRTRYPYGTIVGFFIGLIVVYCGYGIGKDIVLQAAGAYPASGLDLKSKTFINVVAEVATAAGLPRPAAYIVQDPDPNAFATGTDPEDSAIAVTTGLLDVMTREELAGVVAHEMSHIRNYDIRLMTVITSLAGVVGLAGDAVKKTLILSDDDEYGRRRHSANGTGVLLSTSFSSYSAGGAAGAGVGAEAAGSARNGGTAGLAIYAVFFILWLLLVIFSPLLSKMLKMAISRQREYLADASAAELTRNPKGLISALEKIYAATGPTASIGESLSHLCIMDPRGSKIEEQSGLMADLLATHPPMQKRILALKAMAYMHG